MRERHSRKTTCALTPSLVPYKNDVDHHRSVVKDNDDKSLFAMLRHRSFH